MPSHPSFVSIGHRPWPLPEGPWRWRQSWVDLLFAHWPVSRQRLRSVVPPGLEIQEYGGTSWVGVVPFRMEGVMHRPLPDFPGVSAFPELNLRLYVERDGKPGVWFLSLDAGSRLAVWAARRYFHLPYHHAAMRVVRNGARIEYDSRRSADAVRFTASYAPASDVYRAPPGTLEHFLTERYCLYAQSPSGQLFRAEVHHVPWPLQQAEAEIRTNQLLDPHGLSVEGAPLLHFAGRLDVAVWPLQALHP